MAADPLHGILDNRYARRGGANRVDVSDVAEKVDDKDGACARRDEAGDASGIDSESIWLYISEDRCKPGKKHTFKRGFAQQIGQDNLAWAIAPGDRAQRQPQRRCAAPGERLISAGDKFQT
jgi:hypothetical protein